ncbi:MAG: hypothetical protein ABEN55_05665 [Bradymonadaceae bacterium]
MATDVETSPDRRTCFGYDEAVGAGAIAGLIGGTVMALAAMIRAAIIGAGFWLPMQNVAAVWYGVGAYLADGGSVFVGLVTHLAISAGWGALYGVFVDRETSIGASMGMGLLYGASVWLLMTYIALPLFNSTMAARVEIQPFWFWFGIHLLFGGTIGILTPAFARARAGEEAPERAGPGRDRPEEQPV